MTKVYIWTLELRLPVTKNRTNVVNHISLETDGQRGSINDVLKQYPLSYINYSHDDWGEWLPVKAFSKKNADSETTDLSLLFANYRYHSQIQGDLFPAKGPEYAEAWTQVQPLEELKGVLRSEIARAQK